MATWFVSRTKQKISRESRDSDAEGVSIMRWPAEQTTLHPYGVEGRDENTGTELIVPWHRISYVRLGN